MRIGNRHQPQRARIGALLGVLRYQPRVGLDIIEIFDDRQRLEHGMAVVNKRRHHALGVDSLISRLELLAGKDIDRNFLERQSLELRATLTRNEAIDRQNPWTCILIKKTFLPPPYYFAKPTDRPAAARSG
jgi:hypothetical protein